MKTWTLSLNTATGKASYALLVNAFEDKKPISIEGASDCTDAPGYERVKAISVEQPHKNDATLYLYKGDGQTRVGRIYDIQGIDGNAEVFYLGNEYSTSIRSMKPNYYGQMSNIDIGYTRHSCQGDVAYRLRTDRVYLHPDINDGKTFTLGTPGQTYGTTRIMSQRRTSTGECEQLGHYEIYAPVAPIQPYHHPICGEKPCQIKP
ncbi:hypothetical protein N473_07530 [Pseudoalteromonas luteoviolacea CPMOR-1]|uniref:Uncharacterized protein n=1 Tax=Pseudoalteromonas luteoviolacea CPMOR-1 TaxID=1365248 RepID=A0A167NH52_9GAMM|nr:hypothetical protein [Pseudoalteromonas luteoviolacea]KZN68268.1 hypothetical protein N473_07530 [Pseudoalteromonas luteoviolacea CPMOR-1]